MEDNRRQSGFSLIETMLAVGTLAIGMVFIGGTFMAGVYFASISTERTIATVVTDEAIAKIVLYSLDPNDPNLTTAGFVPYEQIRPIPTTEFLYPSSGAVAGRQYSWSAICRREGSNGHLVEFTVFVSRGAGANARYWVRGVGSAWPQLQQTDLPHPVRVNMVQTTGLAADELTIKDAVSSDNVDETTFLDGGSVIVDDVTGQIYRVKQRYPPTQDHPTPDRVQLDRSWAGSVAASTGGAWVWAVPPPVSGGRNPFVAVYQKVIRF